MIPFGYWIYYWSDSFVEMITERFNKKYEVQRKSRWYVNVYANLEEVLFHWLGYLLFVQYSEVRNRCPPRQLIFQKFSTWNIIIWNRPAIRFWKKSGSRCAVSSVFFVSTEKRILSFNTYINTSYNIFFCVVKHVRLPWNSWERKLCICMFFREGDFLDRLVTYECSR